MCMTSESEMRDLCKRYLEALELWLRRLIDDQLSAAFGQDFIDATRPDGSRLISAELARNLAERQDREPKRFSRPIDAALLHEQISIVCRPDLYRQYFQVALRDVFPSGHASARAVLQRLVPPRNALAHANPLSMHEICRVLCYSMDVIEGLKSYYSRVSMSQLYNVPTVIRVWDSLGHEEYLTRSNRDLDGPTARDYSRDKSAYLQSGDTLWIEVDVDPTFDEQDYDIEWHVSNIGDSMTQVGRRFVLQLSERYVSTRFCAVCYLTSKKNWHRLGLFDDQIDMTYKVLPPVEQGGAQPNLIASGDAPETVGN